MLMNRTVKVAPSVLAADFLRLGEDIRRIEDAGADMIHWDVMDAHFVPNLSLGLGMLETVRKATKLYIDVHLMMDNPEKYLKTFADAGADGITIHLEVHPEPAAVLEEIRSCGKDCGLSINPDMPVERLRGKVGTIRRLLLMSVFPGFGGQKFIPESLDRLREARALLDAEGRADAELQVDGGVGLANAGELVAAGGDCLVAGTALFRAPDMAASVRALRVS
jgi:ribulose-phosphate 3-epimerase